MPTGTELLRWLLAAFHLLAFGIGLGAIWVRARALQGAPDEGCIRRVLRADSWWGVAALLWLVTGLLRLMMGTEKPTTYYMANHLFWLKMGLFILVFLLEVGPMIGFVGWRNALRHGKAPDTSQAPRWALTSRVQVGLVVLLLFVATAMARGLGAR